ANTLGHALFDKKGEPHQPKTDPQTPAARGSMPAVLVPSEPPPPPPIVSKRHASNRPPPPQVVALSRPSGPPIPREEPEPEPEPAPEEPEGEAELSSETLDDEATQALLA